MKKTLFSLALVALVGSYSCKPKTAENNEEVPAVTSAEGAAQPTADNPKPAMDGTMATLAATAMPDTIILGKKQEAFVKIIDLKAVPLSNPDGTSEGTELSYKIEVTNRNKIGDRGVYVNPSQFRLVLDNGNKITHDEYNTVDADPESTETSGINKFKIPAGRTAVALNLFYDETTASIKLTVK